MNTPGGSISRLVRSYPSLFVAETDGCDYLESYDAFRYAFAYARERKGPALVHAHVVRPYSHSLSDDEKLYRPVGERNRDAERDPVPTMVRWLVDEGVATADVIQPLKAEIDAEVTRAADEAARRPNPAPTASSRTCTPPTSTRRRPRSTPRTRRRPRPADDDGRPHQRAALRDEMARDGRIVVWGEDVADASRDDVLTECKGKGGVFKVTSGLQKPYGNARVFNSPLAEAGIVGRAIGWAARGLKPVVEIQFFDYIWPAMQQLRDELATARWRSDGTW